MSERYAALSRTVKDNEVPEFDNLYLDMNGIIHNCSHPNDEDPNFRITEEQIFKDVTKYIENLFRIIRPQKVFYMAVDGCAPRAKMNQQRARRFRSAKDAEEALKQAKAKGEVINESEEGKFDSNCITPGTPFMVRLQTHLEYFVRLKITTDPAWKKIKVILDGHQCPGEGEHKIMDYIRMIKSQKGYDKFTRHCMYGLDADLMILGLVSHEPYFFLLREEVQFGGRRKTKREASAETKTWHLLSLTLFRDYIRAEFSPIESQLTFEYDFERLLDDWVLLGFFVGNDFLPHLPDFHIGEDIKPWIYSCYREVIVKLDGWITDAGVINMSRLQKLLEKLSDFDTERFSETYADLKWFGGKTGKKTGVNAAEGSTGGDTSALSLFDMAPSAANQNVEDDDNGESLMDLEFQQHKRLYYSSKLEIENVDDDVITNIGKEYVTGLQWVLLYYFKGVPAWGWFYPYHYAPYVSDLRDLTGFQPQYSLGEPFLPFQQLMSVLPAASRHGMVPEVFQPLMVDPESPILDFYPLEFATDLNGKKQDWEAIVLICFIDEARLLGAMKPLEGGLTSEEKSRNIRTTPIELVYDNTHPSYYAGPLVGRTAFPAIQACCVRTQSLPWPHTTLDRKHIALLEGVDLDKIYMVGYPSLRHLSFTHQLRKGCVKVFDRPTVNNSIIVMPTEASPASVDVVDTSSLGNSVWVEWPHLREALATSISDINGRITFHAGKKELQVSKHSGAQKKAWAGTVADVSRMLLEKFGVDSGEVKTLVHVHKLTEIKPSYGKDGAITLKKNWSVEESVYPYQMVVKKLDVVDPQLSRPKTVVEKFAPGAMICHLGSHHRGCIGAVLRANPTTNLLDITLRVLRMPPNLRTITEAQGSHTKGQRNFMPSHQAARKAKMSGRVIGRLLSSLYIYGPSTGKGNPQKFDVGLSLKFNKRQQEVMGYTLMKSDGSWLMSDKTVEIFQQYKKKFPKFISALEANLQYGGDIDAEKLFPNGDGVPILTEVVKWVRALPTNTADTVPCGSNYLLEQGVRAVEQIQDRINAEPQEVVLNGIRPHDVHLISDGPLSDRDDNIMMGDRVVVISNNLSVPFGYEGNIVSIYNNEARDVEVVFDKSFAGGVSLQGRCSPNRGIRVSQGALMKRSEADDKYKGSSASAPAWSKETPIALDTIPPAAAPALSVAPQQGTSIQNAKFSNASLAPAANGLLQMLQKSGATVGGQNNASPDVPLSAPPPSSLPTSFLEQSRATASATRLPEGMSPDMPRSSQSYKKSSGRAAANTFDATRQPQGPKGRGFKQRRSTNPATNVDEEDLDEYAKMWHELQRAQNSNSK